MSTPHQAIAEWHAKSLAATKQAKALWNKHEYRQDAAMASEVAALNATLCDLGALLVEAVEALKAKKDVGEAV